MFNRIFNIFLNDKLKQALCTKSILNNLTFTQLFMIIFMLILLTCLFLLMMISQESSRSNSNVNALIPAVPLNKLCYNIKNQATLLRVVTSYDKFMNGTRLTLRTIFQSNIQNSTESLSTLTQFSYEENIQGTRTNYNPDSIMKNLMLENQKERSDYNNYYKNEEYIAVIKNDHGTQQLETPRLLRSQTRARKEEFQSEIRKSIRQNNRRYKSQNIK